MKRLNNHTVIVDDNLVIRWIDNNTRQVLSQGKRLSTNHPALQGINKAIRKLYIIGGILPALKLTSKVHHMGFRQALNLINSWRKGV